VLLFSNELLHLPPIGQLLVLYSLIMPSLHSSSAFRLLFFFSIFNLFDLQYFYKTELVDSENIFSYFSKKDFFTIALCNFVVPTCSVW